MARKAKSQLTQKRRLLQQSPFFSKYAFVIRDWTKRRSISGGIYKKIGCNEIWYNLFFINIPSMTDFKNADSYYLFFN